MPRFIAALQPFCLLVGYRNWRWSARQKQLERGRADYLWRDLMKRRALGALVDGAAQLSEKIAGLYQADPQGQVLPLAQALRLFDVYQKQNSRFRAARKRLDELRALRSSWLYKSEQLREMGEPAGDARTLATLDAQIESWESARHQARSSCYRLDKIVDGARQVMHARQLHEELDRLSARLPAPTAPGQAEFAPESFEEIERQIGREIEDYLRLERETDELLG